MSTVIYQHAKFTAKHPYFNLTGVIINTFINGVSKMLEVFGPEYTVTIYTQVLNDYNEYMKSRGAKPSDSAPNETPYSRWMRKLKQMG